MKKKSLSILSILLIMSYSLQAVAQSVGTANAKFKAYTTATLAGNKVAIYNALYESYKANLDVLKTASKSSSDYIQAKNNLLQMWPNLEYAAIFYSSQNYQTNAVFMTEAYIGMPLMDDFRGVDFDYSANRAQLIYFVASRFFNAQDYKKAIPFLNEYLKTGDEKNRKNVFLCLVKACKEEKEIQMGRNVIDEAVQNYPNDYNVVSMAVNFCQDMKDFQGLQTYLDKAHLLKPYDKTVLNIQGKLYEDTRKYGKALEVYQTMLKSNPKSLEINKHIALNCYNLGVFYSNSAMTESDNREKKNLQKQAKDYFMEAESILIRVLQAEPSSLKYNTALAIVYSQLGKGDRLEETNKRLASLGAGRVSADAIPQMLTFSGNAVVSNNALVQAPTNVSSGISPDVTSTSKTDEIPTFSNFAKKLIEDKIKQWQIKDPYETVDEYKARVTEQARNEKVAELKKQAEADYVATYSGELSTNGFKLMPYDAENGVFLIESSLGQLVVPVPRENNEARLFEQNWNGMSFQNPQYYIADDKLALSALTFMTPTGMNYQYSNKKALSYTETKVDVQFDAIDYSGLAQDTYGAGKSVKVNKQKLKVGQSDVDMNIPNGSKGDDKTFVLIIANENYKAVAEVPYTTNDGKTFAAYCHKTLGMPESNVHVTTNATFIDMRRQIKWLADVLTAYKGEARAIVYYAGHGIPDEATHSAYLLPIDGDGTDITTGLSLAELYKTLGGIPSRGVTVLLDACFSGATREGSMLASARGVAIKAKPEQPKGNLVVLSAAQGDETAWPYKEKGHGLFTYYLLKKLQESEGRTTLGELSAYITDEVSKRSLVTNGKSQTPTVSAPASLGNDWKSWKLK